MLVGQASTAVLVGFGLLWIPLMRLISGQLYQYIQSVQSYISPPIAAVFLLGLFWRRMNAKGAMAALLLGLVLGAARLVAELNKGSLSGALFTFADINFLHFAVLLFLVSVAVLVVVSLATPPPPYRKVAGLTYALANAPQEASAEEHPPRGGAAAAAALAEVEEPGSRRVDVGLSVLVVALVGCIWLYFSH